MAKQSNYTFLGEETDGPLSESVNPRMMTSANIYNSLGGNEENKKHGHYHQEN